MVFFFISLFLFFSAHRKQRLGHKNFVLFDVVEAVAVLLRMLFFLLIESVNPLYKAHIPAPNSNDKTYTSIFYFYDNER